MDEQSKQILSKITHEQWIIYFNELVLYAQSKCSKWSWETSDKENLPKGYSPESIATEALKRFYRGTRKWNHETYPGDNPVKFLKSVVRSIVSEIGRSKAHKTAASLESETNKLNGDGNGFEREILPEKVLSGLNPQREATAYEVIYFAQIHRRILFALQDEKDLLEYYRLRRDGLNHKVMADVMNKTDNEIEALRVRFSRRTKTIRQEFVEETERINRIPEGGARVSTLK
jgi:hypothetical protein